jgi:hypothetical protein
LYAAVPVLPVPHRFNVAPDALPDLIFASVGRCVWRDIGGVAVAFRLMMKVLVRGCARRQQKHVASVARRRLHTLAGSARMNVLRTCARGSGFDAGVCLCRALLLLCAPLQDFNLMSTALSHCAPMMADFKKNL